jgi:uncharacterized membrane protein (UPF0127 family)
MKTADTPWKKFRGLMMKSRPEPMLFVFDSPGRYSFHTLFMRFPIDFVFLDKRKRVVEIRENIRPWRAIRPKSEASYVLELAAGAARKRGIKTGQKMKL